MTYDKVTLWFAGHLVYGPIPREGFDFGTIIMENGPEFYKKYGRPCTIWAEPNTPAFQKMIRYTIRPKDHMLCRQA
ncbi:hypothetical protein McanCB49686_004562 [Microsporum canis]